MSDIKSSKAQFYTAISKKHEKNGDIDLAIQNMLKAIEEDPENVAFYNAEISRLRELISQIDPQLKDEIVRMYREKSIIDEDLGMYEHAEKLADALSAKLAQNDYDSILYLTKMYAELDVEGIDRSKALSWVNKAMAADPDRYEADREKEWSKLFAELGSHTS